MAEDDKAAPFFKATVEDKVYELQKLTLGDARILKAQFGCSLADYSTLNPDFLAGAIFLCIRNENPGWSVAKAMKKLDAIDFAGFIGELADDAVSDDEDEAKTEAPKDEASAPETVNAPSESGSTETTPESSGSPA